MPKKVLLIGATGSLGSVIAEELSQRSDIDLSVLVRRPNRLSAHVNATRFVGAVE